MKTIVIIISLALLTFASFLLMRNLDKELVDSVEDPTIRKIATAYGVTTTYYDSQQRARYKMLSDEVQEYSHQGGTKLYKPTVSVFDEHFTTTWKGTSDTGHITADKKYLTLKSNVTVIQSPNEKPIYINSPVMYYNSENNELTSDQFVIIDDKISRQESQSLLLNTKTKEMTVTNSVRAHFVAPAKKSEGKN